MTIFEKLDFIADAYNPTLLSILFVHLFISIYQRRWLQLELLVTTSAIGLGIVYSLMFIDNKLGIWPAMGLDYSTHTAFAVCVVLISSAITGKFVKSLVISLGLYIVLMIYQGYHSLLDILTTAIVILILLGGVLVLRRDSLAKMDRLKKTPV